LAVRQARLSYANASGITHYRPQREIQKLQGKQDAQYFFIKNQ
jgi:hypothetical protein